MPKYKYLAVFHPCIMASSSRLDLYYLSTLPADLLGLNVLSHQRREKQENDGDDVFIFYYFLIYWMCVEECVSPPFLLATPLHVCGGLGYLKPWKERKKKELKAEDPGVHVGFVHICKLKPSRHNFNVIPPDSVTCFYLVLAPRLSPRRSESVWGFERTSSVKCCCFSFFSLVCCFTYCVSLRLRCPVT